MVPHRFNFIEGEISASKQVLNNDQSFENEQQSAVLEDKVEHDTNIILYEVTELCMSIQHFPENLSELQAIYFLKNHSGPIPQLTELSEYLEIGYFANTALKMLEQALHEVYLPLMSTAEFEPEPYFRKPDDSETAEKEHQAKNLQAANKFANLKSDLLLIVQRFSSNISHIVQQVAGETRLKIPEELSSLDSMEVLQAKEDREIVHKLEILADEWIEIVSGALSKEAKKVPKGNVHIIL